MVDIEKKVVYQNSLGIQLRYHLNEAYNHLNSDYPNAKLAELELAVFIERIPDDGEIAEFLTGKLHKLDNVYKPVWSELKKLRNSGRYFEMRDAENQSYIQKVEYLLKKYYICDNVYNKFKLYNADSILEYEL